jgi:hypothetical protein
MDVEINELNTHVEVRDDAPIGKETAAAVVDAVTRITATLPDAERSDDLGDADQGPPDASQENRGVPFDASIPGEVE